MSQEEIQDNEEQVEYIEQEETSGPSKGKLFVDGIKNWINTQNKTVVYAVTGIFVVVLGFGAYQYLYKAPLEKEGQEAIFKVQQYFGLDSFSLVIKEAPALADKYSGTDAGNLCNYYLGVSYLKTGNYKKSIEYLEDVKFKDVLTNVGSIGLLGDAHVEDKNLEEGLKYYLKAYKKAKSIKDETDAIRFGFKAARVYKKQNDWKNVLALYESMKADYKENIEMLQIDKYIAEAKAHLDMY
jgi:tetratricopeptide (TPR) repeat protein